MIAKLYKSMKTENLANIVRWSNFHDEKTIFKVKP